MMTATSRALSLYCPSPCRRLAVAAAVLLLAACATRQPAPVENRIPVTATPRPAAAAVPVPPPGPAAARTAAEPDWRPPTYTVKRGDTLYAIALDHGLDYRELAAWNNLEDVNVIRIGQVLRLAAPGDTTGRTTAGGTAPAVGVVTTPLRSAPPVVPAAPGGAAPAATASAPPQTRPPVSSGRQTDTYKSQPKVIKEPYSEQALREMQRTPVAGAPAAAPVATAQEGTSVPAPASASAASTTAKAETKGSSSEESDDKIEWVWPATGKVVTGFSDTANMKGIDIAGKAGQPVLASAAGKVVYAGTGLRGYGKLIIIKHSKAYLSAYAHNREILVKEGQQVSRGQKIAEMGNTDADQVKLHFEIRRLGKPMDPLKFLPPA